MPSVQRLKPLTIQRRTVQTDGWSDAEDKWEDIASPRGSVVPLSGRELVEAMQTTAVGDLKVSFRWSPSLRDLSTADRVKFGDRLLHIKHVANVEERNREFVLMCSEGE